MLNHLARLFGVDLITLTRRVCPEARIVFTCHEFLAICAADGHMLRRNDRTLCTRASPARCHQCFPDQSPEHFFMRALWMQRHLSAVDVFTTPSRFMIAHFVEWGLPREKIVHVTNGQRDYAQAAAAGAGPEAMTGAGAARTAAGVAARDDRERRNRFGFFGQLVDVKGVWLLLEAVRILRAEGFSDFAVEINGDNLRYASAARREAFLAEEAALPFEERLVTFNGPYSVDQLAQRMARIDWVVVPSVWWEIFGLEISEALMFRKPLIVPAIGGPGERVRDGVDGWHFSVGDAGSLARTLRAAAEHPERHRELRERMGAPPNREAMVAGFLAQYAADHGDDEHNESRLQTDAYA